MLSKFCKTCGDTKNLRQGYNHGKFVTYNICKICYSKKLSISHKGKPLNLTAEGRKRLSILKTERNKKYFSNIKNRKQQSERLKKYFNTLTPEERSNQCAWNKGLNKNIDLRVLSQSISVSKTLTGHATSANTRKKISVSNTGLKRTFKTRLNISNAKKGRHFFNTGQFKKNVSPWNKGKEMKKLYPASYESMRLKKIGKKQDKELVERRMTATFKALQNRPTSIEKKMIKILDNNNLINYKYVGDGAFWVNKKNPDFIDNSNKIIIEVFGSYWHKGRFKTTEEAQNDEDKLKKHYLNYGYKTVIIWDYDLNNEKIVLNKIKKIEGM